MKNSEVFACIVAAIILFIVIWVLSITLVETVMDKSNNSTYYHEDNIDMNNVIDFDVNNGRLILYTKDGSAYYWEK